MKKVPLALLACGVLAAASAASAHAGMVAYGTDRTSTLYQFDPMTGSVTSIGPLGIGPVTALATDPVTKILYTDPGGGERFSTPVSGCLYTVDRATGAATLVGCDPNQGGRDPIAGLAFSPGGTFYGVRLASNAAPNDNKMHLCRIDKETGVLTDIGLLDDWCYGYGSAFGTDGQLYTWSACPGVGLLRVSTADASRTVIGGTFKGFPETGGLRIPDMALAPNGVLWATVVGGDNPRSGVANYYTGTVDTATGDVTYVATLPTSIQTIEFKPPAVPAPALSGWALGLTAAILAAVTALKLIRRKPTVSRGT